MELESPLSAIAPRVVLEISERIVRWAGQRPGVRCRVRKLGFRVAIDELGAGPPFPELRW